MSHSRSGTTTSYRSRRTQTSSDDSQSSRSQEVSATPPPPPTLPTVRMASPPADPNEKIAADAILASVTGASAITLQERTDKAWLFLVDRGTADRIICKVMPTSTTGASSRESSILSMLPVGAPYIVRYMGSQRDPSKTMDVLMLEFCTAGTLRARCRAYPAGRASTDPPPLTPELTRSLFRQLVQAVASCHASGVIHGDIKPCNVFLQQGVGGHLETRLGDFGLSVCLMEAKSVGGRLPHMVCSRWHRPPELLIAGHCMWSEAIDIWALGATFGEMLLHRPLFPTGSDDLQLGYICSVLGTPTEPRDCGVAPSSHCDARHSWALPTAECPTLLSVAGASTLFKSMPQCSLRAGISYWPPTFGGRPDAPSIPDLAKNLLLCMLDMEPSRRPTAARILEHPYLTS